MFAKDMVLCISPKSNILRYCDCMSACCVTAAGSQFHYFHEFIFSNIVWINNCNEGFLLNYPDLSVFAVCTDQEKYAEPCVYMLVQDENASLYFFLSQYIAS